MFAIGVEAGHQHVEAMFMHGIIDWHPGIAANHLFDFGKQRQRVTFFKADEVLFVL